MLTSNLPIQGMNSDVNPKFQDEQSYRWALNATLETAVGDYGTLSNEQGNAICGSIPEGKKVVGHSFTDDEDIILALYSPDGEHELGIYNPLACSYTTVAIGSCLNFSDQKLLNILFRIRNGCDRVINFTDDYNEYRVANLTDTSEWVDASTKQITDCSKIQYDRDFTIPCASLYNNGFSITEFDSGGNVEVGTYSFAVRYLDIEENATD